MKTEFQGKVVVVTGASRGIGRAIALAFARRGAKLVLAARSSEGLAEVEREIQGFGGEALAIPTDVASKESVAMMVETAERHFGGIDVLVNNAGISRVGRVDEADFSDNVREIMQASLFGAINVTQAALPIMKARGKGAIVNMSSVMGRKTFARFGSYAIVMHGVSAFNDALRQELAGTGISVTVIHPGLTATDLLRESDAAEMPPSFRHMTPMTSEYVGERVVKGVARGKARVIMPWIANTLLLGEAIHPRIGDALARGLTFRPFAILLGLSRGKTYHEAIASV